MRPSEEDQAEEPDLTDTVDLRSAEAEEPAADSGDKQDRHKHRGQKAAETVKLPPVDDAEGEADEAGSQDAAQSQQRSADDADGRAEAAESGPEREAAEAEQAGAAVAAETAAERGAARSESRAADDTDSADDTGSDDDTDGEPEATAEAEKPGVQKAGSAEASEPLAETVNLRDLLPEEPAAAADR